MCVRVDICYMVKRVDIFHTGLVYISFSGNIHGIIVTPGNYDYIHVLVQYTEAKGKEDIRQPYFTYHR